MNKILVIDYDKRSLIVDRELLKKSIANCRVLTAQSGVEGIKIAQNELPDTIILSIIMPEMDGYEICEKLKANKQTRNIPIILVSRILKDTNSRVLGLKSGADAFLSRPFDPTEITAQVNAMLRIKKAEDNLRTEKKLLEKTVLKRTIELTETKNKLNTLLDATTEIAFFNENDEPVHSIGTVQDITERKKAEKSLKKSEEKYRSLIDDVLDTSAVGIIILDSDFKVAWINKAMEEYFGIKRGNVIGEDKRQLIKSKIKNIFEDPATFKKRVFATYDDNNYIENFECHVLPQNNHKERWLSHWSQPIRTGLYKNGRIEQYTDITERKQTENALYESKALLQTVIGAIPDLVWMKDTKGAYLTCNPRVESLFGTTVTDICGKTDYDLVDKELADFLRQKDKDAIAAGKPTTNEEEIVFAVDGHREILETIKTPINNTEGQLIGVLGIARDITYRKQVELELLQRENYLFALNEAKEILATTNQKNVFQQFVNILGAASNASRTYIFINHTSKTGEALVSQKAEYCAEGIKPEIDNPDLQSLIYDEILGRWYIALSKGKIIVGKVRDFPKSEKEFLELEDIKAILIIPIISENKFVGFIGFDNCISDREWDTAEQNYLKVAANDLAQFIERNKILKELREEKEFSENALNSLYDNFAIVDMEGKFIRWNNRLKVVSGYSNKEISSMTITDFFRKEDKKAILTGIVKENARDEVTLVTKNGRHIPYELSGSIIKNSKGEPAYTCGIGRDITERKIAEEQLKTSKEFAENLLETANSIVVTLDTDANIKTFNKHAEQLTGYTKEEIIDKNWFEIFTPPLYTQSIQTAFNKKIDSKTDNSQFENPILTKSGEERIISWSNNITYNNAGKINGLMSIGVDISERKQTEDNLRIQHEMAVIASGSNSLDFIMQSLLGLCMQLNSVDSGGIYLVDEITGAINLKYQNGLNPDFAESVSYYDAESPNVKLINQGKPVYQDSSEFLHQIKDAIPKKVGIKAFATIPIRFKEETIAALNVASHTHNEISANSRIALESLAAQLGSAIFRAQAVEKIKTSEDKFKSFAEQSPNMIFINQGGRIKYANIKCTQLMGYSEKEFYSKDFNFRYLIAPEYLDLLERSFKNHRSGKDIAPYEYILISKTGNRINAIINSKLIDFEGSKAILGIVTDITEQKKTENKLQKYAETQEVLLREVNHRVKNNLSAIIAILHKEHDHAATKGLPQLSVIDDLEKRIRGLATVHSLLSSGGWQPIKLSELCRQVIIVSFRNLPLPTKIDLQVGDSKVHLNSNQAHYLTLVLNELATNTIKYAISGLEKARVTVEISSNKNDVQICYCDNGPGYPQQMLDGDFGKSGVGFELIQGIVGHSLGGQIQIENDHGAKTLITFENEITELKS